MGAQSNLGTGRIATTGGRSIHSRAAQSYRSTVFSRWRLCARSDNAQYLSPPDSPFQTAAQSVQPFLHSRCRILPIRYIAPRNFPPNLPLSVREGSGSNLIYYFLMFRNSYLEQTVKAKKLAYYGHTMRKQGSCLEKEIM